MNQNWEYSTFGQIMTPAKVERCKSRTDLPILSITMRDGIVFQSSRFKKVIASVSTENYKIVRNGKDIITGEFARNKRKFHLKEVRLAKQLMYVSDVDDSTRQFLMDLVLVNNKGKFERMAFYRKSGMDREKHSLWMRLWV